SGQRLTISAARLAAHPNATAGANSTNSTAITTGATFDMRTILSGPRTNPLSTHGMQRRTPPQPQEATLFRRSHLSRPHLRQFPLGLAACEAWHLAGRVQFPARRRA